MKKLFGVFICLMLMISGCGGGGDNGSNKTKIAVITGGGYYNSEYYANLLTSYKVTNIDIDNATATDFSSYKLIIIGANGGLSQTSINKIYNSKKPVIGIGSYGRNYFKKIPNASTEYPYLYNATLTPITTDYVNVKNNSNIIWTQPNKIDVGTGSVILRESYELASMIYAENWTNENNISFGYIGSSNVKTYDTLCLENKHYFLWGYSEPNMLTSIGKQLFANVVYYMLNL